MSIEIKVNNVEFASGQEPDLEYESEVAFASLVRVNFTVQATKVASILGKQFRTLDKHLKDIGPKTLIHKITDDEDVLAEVVKHTAVFIRKYVKETTGDRCNVEIGFAEESDLPYTARVDSRELSVTVECEAEVLINVI